MNAFNKPLNTVALDVALSTLFSDKGRDDAKRAYEQVNAAMTQAFAEGAASRNDELAKDRQELAEHIQKVNHETNTTIQQAERVGFEKGRANAYFEQAVEKLNAEAARVSPALEPQATSEPGEETALVNAVSALG